MAAADMKILLGRCIISYYGVFHKQGPGLWVDIMRLISLILVLATATLAVIFRFLTHLHSTLPIRLTQRGLVLVQGTALAVM